MQVKKAVGRDRRGKKSLPKDRRRVILSTRVLPSTLEYLNSLNQDTPGRAIDLIVKALQPGAARDMISQGVDFSIVKVAG